MNQRRLKDLLVSGIGWLSHINIKVTWYPALAAEIQAVFDRLRGKDIKQQTQQLPDDLDENNDTDEDFE